MPRVVVVGAGCFGGWIALQLARAKAEVTLVDAYGPANSRASSGGETRIIRLGYGAQEIYTRWSWRSLELWKALFDRIQRPELFHETGVLWMARDPDPLAAATLETLERLDLPHQWLSRLDLEARWPQVEFGSIAWGILEPASGVLMARRAVHTVVREAETAGVRFVTGTVEPRSARERGGETFVFACGPWLPKIFPDLLADRIFTSRQEIVYLGPPPGDRRFAPPLLPAFIDFGDEMYGVPDIEGRGFKIALDRHGAPFDPDSGERTAGATFGTVRAYVERRLPALGHAPIVGAEVCQYENTSNGDFLIDRHPALENVWMVGGGSGHGFKHGPAVGEYVARLVLEDGAPEERFRLATKAAIQNRAVF